MKSYEIPSLQEKKWKAFAIGDLFYVSAGEDLYRQDTVSGDIPFISASGIFNGVTKFIGGVDESLLDRCFLGVNRDGSSVGEAFFHPYECFPSSNIRCLHLKNGIDGEFVLLFCAQAVKMQKNKYSYGYKFGTERMKKQKIMLPVNEDQEPDWEYMKQYIESIMTKKLRQYVKFPMNEEHRTNASLKSFKPFLLTEIFPEICRGKRLKKLDHEYGCVPYVSSSAAGNGVDGFISVPESARTFEDCISLANSGSVGSAFYEPFKFAASDHSTSLKRPGTSRCQYLYLACMLKAQASRFSFSREITDSRIKKMHIMLPADDSGKPDWEYMKQYIESIMTKKLRQYVKFLERRN